MTVPLKLTLMNYMRNRLAETRMTQNTFNYINIC